MTAVIIWAHAGENTGVDGVVEQERGRGGTGNDVDVALECLTELAPHFCLGVQT